MADSLAKAQQRSARVHQLLTQVVQKLDAHEQSRILAYLCGYCSPNKLFADGLDAALRGNYPELYKTVRP